MSSAAFASSSEQSAVSRLKGIVGGSKAEKKSSAPAKDSPASAKGAKKAPPKERTLQELIDYTLEEGEETLLLKNLMTGLGYAEQHKVKHIYYRVSEKPILREKGFVVVLENEKPFSLIWSDIRNDYDTDGARKIEIWEYRTNLKGILEQTMLIFGDEGKKEFKFVPADENVYKAFASLHNFLLKDASALAPVKDK